MDPVPVMVGRQAEVERLERSLDALTEDRRGRIVELVGEPGIGKTRLTAELCDRAEDRGYLVLSGLAAEFERDLPFGLVVDALDSYLAAAQGREIERLGGSLTGELATVFPSLHEYVEEGAPQLQDERHRAHRAIRTVLEGLARTRPMVLALDDLHWADDASLEVVATLMRSPPDAPVLVTLAFRSAQEPEIVAATERVAEQGGWLERVELGPLAEDASSAILGKGFEPSRAAELVRECGGNPFYLTELARFDHRSGDGGPTPVAPLPVPSLHNTEVPDAVSDAIAIELRELGERASLFLRAAAITGEPFETDLAAEIAELSDAEALEVLDRLLDVGVVRPTDIPRRFLFRHPLVRRAVYEEAPRGWRLAAHGRAAEALTRRGAAAAERALHVEHAASVGDAESIELLIEAAAETSARAPASSVRWLEAALRLLPEQGPLAERRLELLISLATSLAATGRLQESVDVIARVLEILPEEAVLPRVRLVAACASLKHLLGDHVEAREGLLRHADSVEEGGPEAANLQIELAVDAFYAMEFAEMRDWGRRALASSTPLDDPLLTAAAASICAYGETLLGEVAEAERHRAEATAIVDAASDDELVMRLDALSHLGWTDYHLGHFDEAFWHLERGLTISRATGQVALLTHLRQGRSAVLASWGRLAEARETSEEMAESARLTSNRQALSYSLAAVCWWAALRGQLDDARAAGEESLELAEKIDESTLTVFAGAAVSEMLIQDGEFEQASELLRETCGGEELTQVPRAWKALYCEILARAEAGAGRPEAAAEAAVAAQEAAGELGLHVQLAHAKRAHAVALLAAGDAAAAGEAAAAAAEADEAVGAKIESGRSRLLAGQAFVAAGVRERGIAELRKAESVLADCGSERLCGQARRELRRLGKRTRGARSQRATGIEGLASLTGREREIAELVTARKTNREIAEELVLSEKTIESHMRNVFAKLGVSSRVDVAREVERERPA